MLLHAGPMSERLLRRWSAVHPVVRMPLVSEHPVVHVNRLWRPCDQVVPWHCWVEPLPSAFASSATMRAGTQGRQGRQRVMVFKHWGCLPHHILVYVLYA